jgi:hypothetical protein
MRGCGSAKQQQAKAEDRVAARYIAEQKAKGKNVTPQLAPTSMTTPPPVGPRPPRRPRAGHQARTLSAGEE